ncbi:MAG TPA: class I SAM-dependent methyltransferase [Chthoniobacterales bacterium]|nr:class I SAM-dependent methyltransferase [Chthoniobacterales bacterium]
MLLQRFLRLCADLLAVLRSFIREPAESLQILRTLPHTLAGSEHAKQWAQKSSGEVSRLFAAPAESNPLARYFNAHNEGKGIWKVEHYLDIYHQYFAKFIGKEVNVVEIGVFSGGSLEMWKSYFGPKCKVYGVDIREQCRAYAGDGVEIFIGDQEDRAFWKSFKAKVPQVDILIDDGGHLLEQQVATLEEMLPHLRPGGIYLCEDIVSVHNTFPAYIHGFLRRLNAFEYRPSDLEVDATPFQRSIRAIHVYPYVTVIERSDVPALHFRLPMHGTEWKPIEDAGTSKLTLSGQS